MTLEKFLECLETNLNSSERTSSQRIADTHEQFIEQIRGALAEDDPALIKKRVAFAKRNSWDARAEQILVAIRQIL